MSPHPKQADIMKCICCGGALTITHTEQTTSGAIKRSRICKRGRRVTTYEREAADTLNEHEQRLTNEYRKLSETGKTALWTVIHVIDGE